MSALKADFIRQQSAIDSRNMPQEVSLGEDQLNRLLNILTAGIDSIEPPSINPPCRSTPTTGGR